MKRENGYYWIKPKKLTHNGKWVIATFENEMFWIHGTGEAYTDDSISEIDEKMIVRNNSCEVL
jgi:hypothetical protein